MFLYIEVTIPHGELILPVFGLDKQSYSQHAIGRAVLLLSGGVDFDVYLMILF